MSITGCISLLHATAISAAIACCPLTPVSLAAPDIPSSAIPDITTDVCFVPGPRDCAQVAVAQIAAAGATLDVQAYNFTEPHIIQAIIDAHKRGVQVRVILDKISPSQKGEGADPVHDAGIPTYIDFKPKIAHNKVMVIDGQTVITGSFNFSTNADKSNAENMLVLHDAGLAAAYDQNFVSRLAVSEPYPMVGATGIEPVTPTMSR